MQRNPESGFSLVELMVAMVITLIITGSMYGLLSSGQSAFRTQPERTDRQQNMRAAMDLMMRDVAAAGAGMPAIVQAFTPGLNGTGPNRPDGTATDKLEIVTNTSGFDNEEVCGAGSATNVNGSTVTSRRFATPLANGMDVMVFFANGTWTTRRITGVADSSVLVSPCSGNADDHVDVTLDSSPVSGGAFGNPGATVNITPLIAECGGSQPCEACPAPCQRVLSLGLGRVVRYEIVIDATDNNMPSLVRSENGGAQQVVARGIEDLQVQYVRADAGWPATTGTVSDVPPPINVTSTAADFYQSLVTEVRVTISARTAAQRIQGATAPGGVANLALRGSLASQASPRQALWVLAQDTTTARWN